MTNTNYPSATPTPQSQPVKNKNSKNLVIGLLAVGLLSTWAYLLIEKSKAQKNETTQMATITKISEEKSELQNNFNAALARLDSITGDNNNLQGEKSALQKEIDSRKAEIRKILNDKNASQAQLAKAKTMIAELNSKISGLEEEVTRLAGENQELNVANISLKQEKADLETNLATRTSEKDELEKTVDVASTFSASNIQVVPVDERKSGKEKSTTTSKKVDKLVVSFNVENRVAKSGAADMYLIVTAPDGKIISESGVLNTRTDGDKNFTAKIPVQYVQGENKSVQFPIRQDDFQTGNYKIEIYHNGFKIGEGVRSLKKGGLFG
jgi:peptidoglycan hydrolase CwlO-like protein